uniref:Neural Wiskott-Aldrich syndrome protein-like n=1 Tax=Xenopus tropicalis TaxID=8364 RepID=A0A803KFF1_XENTR|eukprot:XP_012816954.1 PREDICTED: neural Wiskott-Aldrich syndrome protein-like isoform X3 [Xenopus tropicalis]
MALFNVLGSVFQVPETRAQNVSIYYSPKESFKGRLLRRKLSKSDIGSPSNFKHLAHVGWPSGTNLDERTDADLKKLFKLAGIKEEHLKDQEMSRKIFAVIEKKGGMEAVRKETLRMAQREMPDSRYKYRSRSSTNQTPPKRQNSFPVTSHHAAKIPVTTLPSSPFSYIASLHRMPSAQPSPLGDFPSLSPIPSPPLLLGDFSPVPTPAQNKISPQTSIEIKTSLTDVSARPAIPPRPPTLLSAKDSPLIPLPLPSLPASVHKSSSELSFPCQPQSPASCQHNDIQHASVPPPPPPIPPFLKKESPEKACLVLPSCPVEELHNSPLKCMMQTEKEIHRGKEKLRDPSLFLEQIRQGVQLKSISRPSKIESSQNSTIVSALMDVIQKRHKALHGSGV